MASAVYSLRLFAAGGLTSAAGTVGPVVPAGLVYVLRDIDALEITGTRPAEWFLAGQTGVSIVNFFISAAADPGNTQWRGRQVYNTGERIGFTVATGTWSIAASGYQLTLP